MRERIENEIEAARKKQESAKYLEEREWRGYIRALEWVLTELVPDKVRWHEMSQKDNESQKG